MTHSYRPDIDGLRAVAVLGVVAFHAGVPGIAGGFTGVDVFFVISGFLITSLLLQELALNDRIDFWRFYARRARRLMPTFLLVLVTTLAAGVWLLSPALGEVQSLSKAAIAATLMVANVFYLRRLESYFSGPAEFEPLLHTWSLSVEEQYYLVWPALLTAAWMLGTRYRRPRMAVTVVLAAALVLSAATCWFWAEWRNPWAFYLLPARAWELAAGGALAMGLADGVSRRPVLGAIAGLAGAGLIAAAMLIAPPAAWFPSPAAAVPVAGAVLVILGNAWSPRNPVAVGLGLRPLVAIGLASYAWYLWHWPALSLVRIATLGQTDVARDVSISVATLVLSFATLRFYENPLRHRRIASGGKVLGAAWASASLVVAAAGGLIWLSGIVQPTPAERALIEAKADTPRTQRDCHIGLGDAGSKKLGPCLARTERPRLLLWGDSYADHWSPALYGWANGQREKPEIEHLTKDACPPLPGLSPTETRVGLWKPYAGCRAFNDLAQERLAAAATSRQAAVVFSSAWWFRATGFDLTAGGWFLEPHHSFDESAHGVAASLAALEDRLGHVLEQVHAKGLRAVIILQSPQLLEPQGRRLRAPECLFRQSDAACAVPAALHHARVAQVHAAIARVAARFETVRLFDPADGLCNATTCPARIDGIVAYTDDGHISASMSRVLLDRLAPLLDWALGGDAARHAAAGLDPLASAPALEGAGYLSGRLNR